MRKEDEAGFKTLEAENSMVMVWLVNSMDPEIGQTYLFLLTAKEMWDAINKTLSDLGNSTQVYEIKIRICETKKGALGVTKYYGILWQELDHYYAAKWENAEDVAQFKRL